MRNQRIAGIAPSRLMVPGFEQRSCHRGRRSLWQTTASQTSTAREVSVSTRLEILEAEVLQLIPADRSHLLERLIASLDSDPEIEESWEREADRREAELQSGSIAAVPGKEAIARLRAKLRR